MELKSEAHTNGYQGSVYKCNRAGRAAVSVKIEITLVFHFPFGFLYKRPRSGLHS
jgi:hypothetical protein